MNSSTVSSTRSFEDDGDRARRGAAAGAAGALPRLHNVRIWWIFRSDRCQYEQCPCRVLMT
jgi:hypothetical protein